jgi:hypothetical protein
MRADSIQCIEAAIDVEQRNDLSRRDNLQGRTRWTISRRSYANPISHDSTLQRSWLSAREHR